MKKIIISVSLFLLCLMAESQALQFFSHPVCETTSRIFFTSACDLDQDGDPDILYTQPNQDLLNWYENNGNGSFELRQIGTFPGANSVWVTDYDSDGDNDVFASSYDPPKVVLFENDGNQAFTYHLLSEAIPHALIVVSGDLDNDGDYDLACATQDAGKGMMLLRNDGNLVFTPIQLSQSPYSSTWAMIIDLDQDGDLDVLGNNFQWNGGILWYEQTAPWTFTEHLIPFPGAHGFTAGDIDSDGDIDLVGVSCGSEVAWFQNDGNNNFTMFSLENAFDCAVSVVADDIDRDGKTDLVASAWSGNEVVWWKNNGTPLFDRQTVSDSLQHPNCVAVADFNKDGWPDIVAGGYSGKLIWWENSGHGVRVPEKREEKPVKVFYNDSDHRLELTPDPEITSVSVQLFDMQGIPVTAPLILTGPAVIPCDTLPASVYLLKIILASDTVSQKIIVR